MAFPATVEVTLVRSLGSRRTACLGLPAEGLVANSPGTLFLRDGGRGFMRPLWVVRLDALPVSGGAGDGLHVQDGAAARAWLQRLQSRTPPVPAWTREGPPWGPWQRILPPSTLPSRGPWQRILPPPSAV